MGFHYKKWHAGSFFCHEMFRQKILNWIVFARGNMLITSFIKFPFTMWDLKQWLRVVFNSGYWKQVYNQTSSDPTCPYAMLITLCRVFCYKGPELIHVMEGTAPGIALKASGGWKNRLDFIYRNNNGLLFNSDGGMEVRYFKVHNS